MKYIKDHSLTIFMALLGAAMIWFGFTATEDRTFDLWLGLGCGTLTVALFYIAAGFLREKNKPEE